MFDKHPTKKEVAAKLEGWTRGLEAAEREKKMLESKVCELQSALNTENRAIKALEARTEALRDWIDSFLREAAARDRGVAAQASKTQRALYNLLSYDGAPQRPIDEHEEVEHVEIKISWPESAQRVEGLARELGEPEGGDAPGGAQSLIRRSAGNEEEVNDA
ncbi:MAG: hypothetical protein LBD02_10730 [Christensenellaceae bacterium]|jgi:chromosome segregation ATPase|nr:hypothetical protein [Christensenellaceae bacterium]